MTSVQRSTLRLDLKDLAPRATTPHIGRLGLVAISVVAVVSAAVSINSPSASVANVEDLNGLEVTQAEPKPLTGEPGKDPSSASGARSPVVSASQNNSAPQVARDIEESAPTEVDTNPELASLEPAAGMSIPGILRATPEGGKEAIDHRQVRLHMASLAPVISRETFVPLVNLIEAEPSPENEEQPRNSTEIVIPDTSDTEIAAINPEPGNNRPQTQIVQESAAEIDSPAEEIDPLQRALIDGDWQMEKVRKNDTISQLFNRLGISSREAYALVKLEYGAKLNRIRPGEEIQITTRSSAEGGKQLRLEKLKYKVDQFTTLLVQGTDDGYSIDMVEREPEIRYRTVQATIWDSLLGAAKKAEIPFDVVYSLATVFGWQVDFAKDIQSGDSFTAIYEELYLDGEMIDSGQVVAAELVTGGKNLRAVRHVDSDNRVTYYAPDGEGIQGSFLRSPIKFARVTSGFSKRRLHPIKKIWKAHKGVDYGAPMNTPIRSTGDGVVKFVGTKKGYGKTVVLRHGEKYETLYAHMNKFRKGLRSGSRVKQGDVIGYVGRTGWATGPHLHYEFRVAGNHANPLTVELPKSLPIDKRYREEFNQQASTWVAKLENANRIPLARNER